MDLKDLRMIRDELEKLTEGFRTQFDPVERLSLIDRFQTLLTELNSKVAKEPKPPRLSAS